MYYYIDYVVILLIIMWQFQQIYIEYNKLNFMDLCFNNLYRA